MEVGEHMANVANHRVNRNTVKPKSTVGIIIGCQRLNGTVDDLVALIRNGLGAIRTGRDYRIIASEAFETWRLQ